MTRPSLSTIVVAGGGILLAAVLFAVLGDVALAQAPGGGGGGSAPGGTPLPDIGKNARTQVLGALTGILSIIAAIAVLRFIGGRGVPAAALSFIFLVLAAYMILAPTAALNTLKAIGQSVLG